MLESQYVDFYSQLNCCLTAWSGAFCFQWDGFAGIVLNISFFDATEEGGAFSFYRKICKLTPILISGKFNKYFTFMLLALCDGTTAQLQICSSERNVPLLPVDWKTISKRMMPANLVYVTNIKAPEFAVKGAPGRKCVQ